MDIYLITSILFLCISKISAKPVDCGPNTAEIIFTKYGVICATNNEMPAMNRLSLDSSIIPKLIPILSPLLSQQNPSNNHILNPLLTQQNLNNNHLLSQILTQQNPNNNLIFGQQLTQQNLNNNHILNPLLTQQNPNNNHILSPLLSEQQIHRNSAQIDRRPDLIEDKIAKYQRMLLEKLKRDSLTKKFVRHQLVGNQQNLNLDNQRPNVAEQESGEYSGETESQNQELFGRITNNLEKPLIAVNEQNHRIPIIDETHNQRLIREFLETIRQKDANHQQISSQNQEFSQNNRQGVINRFISGISGNVGSYVANNLQKETSIDSFNEEESRNIEPQVSETHVNYQYAMPQNPPHNHRKRINFGFPLKKFLNSHPIEDIVFGSPKIPKINFGFKPLFNEFEPKEIQKLNRVPLEVQQKNFIPNNHKPVWTPLNRQHEFRAIPGSADQYYAQIVTAPPLNIQNILNFEDQKLDQKLNSNKNSYNQQNSASDMIQSSSNKFEAHRPYNEFNLDKTRIEYHGWKPIKNYRNSKSASDQQLVNEDFLTSTPSMTTSLISNDFDVKSYGERANTQKIRRNKMQ